MTIYNVSFPTVSVSIRIEKYRIDFQKTFVFKLIPENYKIHLLSRNSQQDVTL
jgi:hypothetical protein